MDKATAMLTRQSFPNRVTIVSTFPPEKCGVAYYTFGLSGGLSSVVDLLIIANETENSIPSNSLVHQCWRKGSLFYPVSIFLGCMKFAGNLIHVQHHYVLYGGAVSAVEFPLLLLALRAAHKRIVVTLHSVIPRNRLDGMLFEKYQLGGNLLNLKRILITLLTRSIVVLADGLIVHSSSMRNCLIQDYGAKKEKSFIVPHGVSNISPLDSGKAKSLLGLPNGKVVLYQGFITEGKGVDVLIKAFKRVHDFYPDATLVIAGGFRRETDDYAKLISSLVKKTQLTENVKISGFVPEKDMVKYFSAASLIVLPYTEAEILGTSEVLAEVALAGKPIVATKTPKFSGLLRNNENALLVEPSNEGQLAAAILQLLANERLANRLATSLKHDASKNTWDRIGQLTIDVYNKVLGLS